MDVLIIILALVLLMVVAYRGFNVIIFAPICALLAVVLINPSWVYPFFSGIFLERLAGFVKLYFPVFLLGAILGKLMEISGFARAIVTSIIRITGKESAVLTVVIVCSVLTYGGVSLFVVVFAVYPFAAELFKICDIPKRLIPPAIVLGAFTYTMDALPGTPQIQNIIPTTFFHTDGWAAPWLGILGSLFSFVIGMFYLERQRRKAIKNGEGYGTGHINEPEIRILDKLPSFWLAMLPLFLVTVCNKIFTIWISTSYTPTFSFENIGVSGAAGIDTTKFIAIWAVEAALVIGILTTVAAAWQQIKNTIGNGITTAVTGGIIATLNTASEYGFGAVIAALPGFKAVSLAVSSAIKYPLLNEAVTTTTLAGITGSGSGGLSISLALMGSKWLEQGRQLGIPPEVLHRIAAMACGGMDSLPHNGAIVTMLGVVGLTHRQAYKDIFGITLIKTGAVFFAIGLYYWLGIV
ncbi:MAG TPA: GntP family permease [Mucilaginibacter sp.]|jgi:H+/gluconate symporter-like permease